MNAKLMVIMCRDARSCVSLYGRASLYVFCNRAFSFANLLIELEIGRILIFERKLLILLNSYSFLTLLSAPIYNSATTISET